LPYDAFPSIQAAIDRVVPGTVISVAGGTYIESVTISKTLTLVGGTGPPVIRPAGAGQDALVLAGGAITVTGFTFQNARDGVLVSGGAGHAIFGNNLVSNTVGLSNTTGVV